VETTVTEMKTDEPAILTLYVFAGSGLISITEHII